MKEISFRTRPPASWTRRRRRRRKRSRSISNRANRTLLADPTRGAPALRFNDLTVPEPIPRDTPYSGHGPADAARLARPARRDRERHRPLRRRVMRAMPRTVIATGATAGVGRSGRPPLRGRPRPDRPTPISDGTRSPRSAIPTAILRCWSGTRRLAQPL